MKPFESNEVQLSDDKGIVPDELIDKFTDQEKSFLKGTNILPDSRASRNPVSHEHPERKGSHPLLTIGIFSFFRFFRQ